MNPDSPLTLQALMTMNAAQLHRVLGRGHPLDLDALAGRQYLGVDLSMPEIGRRLLWHTFRKTFHRDPDTGLLRGWNVRMEQRGVDGPAIPMRDRSGRARTFGHYRVRGTEGLSFPKGWAGAHCLDYGAGGNPAWDLARLGMTPLVAVNAGSQDLLLGWEVFRVRGRWLPMPLYWALQAQGPLDEIAPVPRP